MKVLRAIGGFFAKIGRWIANTAWIQPLLIVGGIFGIIFSIPYIKSAIENSKIDNTDYDYLYYTDHALGLEDNGRADKLLGYIEEKKFADINEHFGKKFILTFVKSNCDNCREGVEAYKEVEKNPVGWGVEGFKLHTIIVDTKDPNDSTVYLAKKLLADKHPDFKDEITGKYGETAQDKYALYKNDGTNGPSVKAAMMKFADSTSSEGEGLQTPLTFMYDFEKVNQEQDYFNYNGITAAYLNFIDLIKSDEPQNLVTKIQMLQKIWNYEGVFDPNYKD